jgi:phage terminase large subunit
MSLVPEGFDFRNPDYTEIYRRRVDMLNRLRGDSGLMSAFKAHYACNPADFINDWGVTYDPRNIEIGLPATIPFVLFPKQRECIEDIYASWKERKPLLIEKSRDVGLSWLAVGFGVSMCLFHRGFSVGYGSRKEEYVDSATKPRALLWKARAFLKHLPSDFRAGYDESRHSAHMRIVIPGTESYLGGEAGDDIGRGDRTSLYFVDEAAHLARARLVEAALSATTNCRIDLSSVNGMGTVFAEKRHRGTIKVFIFDWSDDPRKDQAWHDQQKMELDPITFAQEIGRDYNAAVENIIIPGEWVSSAIDAHKKLGFSTSGAKVAAIDVADEGRDKNAFAGRHGVVLTDLSQWRGEGSDIFGTVAKAFILCDDGGYEELDYDADGLGAGVRGDARVLNENRDSKLKVGPWRGSGAVVDPSGPVPSVSTEKLTSEEKRHGSARTNGDFFANAKSQAWWALRARFLRTHRAVQEGAIFDHDEMISISSDLKELPSLRAELSRPTWSANGAGKMLIDKAPDGVPSPNLADAVMMCYAPKPRRRAGSFS